jgi:hypothetical protein
VTVISAAPGPYLSSSSGAEFEFDASRLRDFCFDGAALGIGVLSSLVNISRDPHPDVDQYHHLVVRLVDSSCQAFEVTRGLIDRFAPRTLLVFNGRFATSKGIAEAARLASVEVLYHEAFSTHDRYYLSDKPPQSAQNGRKMLWDNWSSAPEERVEIATKFFTPARGGTPLLGARYVESQVTGTSVALTGRRRIVFFASSIDEYSAVEDGVEHTVFDSQRAAVEWLASWVCQRPDTELVIRLHPKIRLLSAREQGWWNSLDAANVITVPADSPVDSYALADSADRVVSYHSSMGVEATYLGKVSILVGDAEYSGLDCVYEPRTIADFERILDDGAAPPKPAENCLPFGYDRMTRGTKFAFYNPSSFQKGEFFGRPVSKGPVIPRGAAKVLTYVDRALAEGDGFRGC